MEIPCHLFFFKSCGLWNSERKKITSKQTHFDYNFNHFSFSFFLSFCVQRNNLNFIYILFAENYGSKDEIYDQTITEFQFKSHFFKFDLSLAENIIKINKQKRKKRKTHKKDIFSEILFYSF